MTKFRSVATEEEADILACQVYQFFDADIIVYKTPTAEEATGEGLWFEDAAADDAVKIFWLKNDNHADIRIFFANAAFEAGWKPDNEVHAKYDGML